MGEQSESQPHTISSSTIITTTTTTTTEALVSTPPLTEETPLPLPPPSQTSSSISTTTKLPCRPKKIRKLSSDTNPENPNTKSSQITKKSSTVKRVRVFPRTMARTLSYKGEIDLALRHLRSVDPTLAQIIDLHAPPTFDSFHPPFHALSKSIIYQQLAFKAGTSIYTRFISLCGGESSVLPEIVSSLTPQQLRQIGISLRKSSYLHDLANKYRNGILSDSSIVEMDDKSLFTMLTMVKGIGPWSVHMFMIFSLHRPDVLPVGDVGVRKGVQLIHGLEQLPRPSQMEKLCEKWRPYRSVASWYMWRFAEVNGGNGGGNAATAQATAVEVETVAVDETETQQQQLAQPMDQINGITNLGSWRSLWDL